MQLETGSKKRYTISVDTHMGVLSGELTLSQQDANTACGDITVMGKTIPFESCVYAPDHYSASFQAMNMTVKTWLSVNADGSIYGFAVAPRHQVMELRGKPQS